MTSISSLWDQLLDPQLPEIFQHYQLQSENTNDASTRIILGRSPTWPYDPKMHRKHPCKYLNEALNQCFKTRTDANMLLYQRHATCNDPKKELLVCLARERRKERLQKESRAAQRREAKIAAEAALQASSDTSVSK